MSRFRFDPDYLSAVAELMKQHGLGKTEMIDGERRLYLEAVNAGGPVTIQTAATPAATPVVAAPAVDSAAQPVAPPGPAETPVDEAKVIRSPMVGTVYLAPNPEAENFVKVGDTIEPGQTVMIIEAMKIMNQINAEVGGVVDSIDIANAAPVEYGEILIRLR
ncbi:MAG: acetyl-CoA carboxylase biotin carboxyl carrier protein [Pseudomonadota bacterium]